MTHAKRVAVVVAALILTAGGEVAVSVTASAARAACGNLNNQYVQHYSTTPGTQEVYEGDSTVANAGPVNLCSSVPGPANQNVTYIGISGKTYGGFSQVGYHFQDGVTGNAPCDQMYAQQREYVGTSVTTVFGSCTNGESHQLWNQWCACNSGTGSYERANVDVTIFIQSPWNPFGAWDYPWRADMFNLSSYQGSDLRGVPTERETFGTLQYQQLTDNALHSMCDYGVNTAYVGTRWSYVNSCSASQSWTSTP